MPLPFPLAPSLTAPHSLPPRSSSPLTDLRPLLDHCSSLTPPHPFPYPPSGPADRERVPDFRFFPRFLHPSPSPLATLAPGQVLLRSFNRHGREDGVDQVHQRVLDDLRTRRHEGAFLLSLPSCSCLFSLPFLFGLSLYALFFTSLYDDQLTSSRGRRFVESEVSTRSTRLFLSLERGRSRRQQEERESSYTYQRGPTTSKTAEEGGGGGGGEEGEG